MTSRGKILIVEDEPKTAQAIRKGLTLEGFACNVCPDGESGANELEKDRYDLVLLDWMLPVKDGVSLLRDLRARGRTVPVLLLTARDAIEDRVEGLDSGADDYLVKPFAFAELFARIRVLLRRSDPESEQLRKVGEITIDPTARRVWRSDDEIAMTPREFSLLEYLIRFEGQVVTRDMIARDVWREPNRHTSLDNVIDVHIANLRKKVDNRSSKRLINTVRGVGFSLRKPEDA